MNPEQDFIKELNSFFEAPFSTAIKNSVMSLLCKYKRTCEKPIEIIRYVPSLRVVYVDSVSDRPLPRIKLRDRILTEDYIIDTVCKYLNIDYELLKSSSRVKEKVYARRLCMHFLYEYTKLSLKNIGERFNGRDHTSVIHSNQTLQDHMETDESVRRDVENLNNHFVEVLSEQQNNLRKVAESVC